ncbi:hypothetical protein COLO4_25902 [Corchorus olitorius]|uniref:Uncharacterized protein n=1 Tax=Corchorus olitorius TaxID=93759 RepID=A0A1R3HZH2_9ROSI|nr:hypothetical protein COLO4_25902 [Corchorus olitorius]
MEIRKEEDRMNQEVWWPEFVAVVTGEETEKVKEGKKVGERRKMMGEKKRVREEKKMREISN